MKGVYNITNFGVFAQEPIPGAETLANNLEPGISPPMILVFPLSFAKLIFRGEKNMTAKNLLKMLSRIALLLQICLWSWGLKALTITDVNGESAMQITVASPTGTTTTTTSTPTIWGGLGGPNTSCSGDSTCDSCAEVNSVAAMGSCNLYRIHNGVTLSVFIKSDSTDGYPKLIKVTDGTTSEYQRSSALTAKGSVATMNVLWADLCGVLNGGDQDCENITEPLQADFSIGISKNNNTTLDDSLTLKIKIVPGGSSPLASCGGAIPCYTLAPGDEKVYVDSSITNGTAGFPNTGGRIYKTLRVFYSTTNLDDAVPARLSEGKYKDLSITSSSTTGSSSDATLGDNKVTGLENGVDHYLRYGFVDEAGNMDHVISPAAQESDLGCAGATATPSTADRSTCPSFVVQPNEVVGLLSEDLNCFVATATLGSPLHSELKPLRDFRNRVLLRTSFGIQLVKQYYNWGPLFAAHIETSPFLRKISQIFLAPLFWVAPYAATERVFWPIALVLLLEVLLILCLAAGLGWLGIHFVGARFRSLSVFQKSMALAFVATQVLSASETSQAQTPEVRQAIEEALKQNPPPQSVQVPHPMADQGLTKITADGTYIYKVDSKPSKRSFSFRAGNFDPTEFKNPETNATFSDLYEVSNIPLLLLDYEWILSQRAGQLGFKIGSGIFTASGQGRFKDSTITAVAREKFTFITFPNSVALFYGLKFWDSQWFVPYGEAGAGYFTFAEIREDGKNPKFGGSPTLHWSAGAAIDLSRLDGRSKDRLREEFGVNAIWLIAEYRSIIGLRESDFNFTSDCINAGFKADF